MIAKNLVYFVIVSLFLANVYITSSNAVLLNISGADIDEAIAYGAKNKRTILGDFSKDWTVSLGAKVGWATLYTGFHNIAYKARKASIEHKEITKKDIDRALESDSDLTFTVSLLGNYTDFAREYHSMLKFGKDLIAPSFEFIPDIAGASGYWPEEPDSIAGCVFKFPIEGIDGNSIVTLVLRPFDGDVLEFIFDLSKMK
ncbi:MAG: hypothetical protein ACUZ8H_14915 [Candidatus Anammoxibacter sp.]